MDKDDGHGFFGGLARFNLVPVHRNIGGDSIRLVAGLPVVILGRNVGCDRCGLDIYYTGGRKISQARFTGL